MLRNCAFFLCCLCAFSSSLANAEPRITADQCQSIETGPGPENLLYLKDRQQLLISSHDRRRFARTGEIYRYDLSSKTMQALPREGEPESFRFRPHGMDAQKRNGNWWLYVISHDSEVFSDQHSIAVYELINDVLHFRRLMTTPLMSAPNDLVLRDNGDIYVTIERANGGSITEMLFLQRKSSVIHYRAGRGWQIATNELSFANGIWLDHDTAYVSQTLGEGINKYQILANGRFQFKEKITNLSLLDAITPGRPGHLMSPAHPSLFQLFWHWRRDNRASPSILYEINTSTGDVTKLFADDGSAISAVSQAIVVNNVLYIGQLFEPFILACPRPLQ